jgi:hypothetical protein
MGYSILGKIAIVACSCILATACGEGGQQTAGDAGGLIGWDGKPVSTETATTTAGTATTPAKMLRAPRPVSLPFVDEDHIAASGAGTSPDLPRTTEAGIRIEATSELFDFGDGDQDAILFNASSSSGIVGLYLDPESVVANGDVTDAIAWASSGGAVMIIFEVGPTVSLLSLESVDGHVDQVKPTSEQIAVLAVPGDGTNGVTATAFDKAGSVVATCAPEGEFGFISCAPPG